jgi:hypothetical protein
MLNHYSELGVIVSVLTRGKLPAQCEKIGKCGVNFTNLMVVKNMLGKWHRLCNIHRSGLPHYPLWSRTIIVDDRVGVRSTITYGNILGAITVRQNRPGGKYLHCRPRRMVEIPDRNIVEFKELATIIMQVDQGTFVRTSRNGK